MDKIKTYCSKFYGHTQYWEDTDEDGVVTRTTLFSDHLHKVLRARKKDSKFNHNEELKNHELIGKKFKHEDEDKECIVQSVHKQWYLGYYLVILYYSLSETKSEMLCTDIVDGKMYGRSHGTRVIKNISCHHPTTIDGIKDIQFY